MSGMTQGGGARDQLRLEGPDSEIGYKQQTMDGHAGSERRRSAHEKVD